MTDYTTIIILTFVGFVALAAVLLVPVYLFLQREEKAASRFSEETAAGGFSGETAGGGFDPEAEPGRLNEERAARTTIEEKTGSRD